MTQMEDVTQVTYLKQRSFRSECKEAKLERNEALKHEKLENELVGL